MVPGRFKARAEMGAFVGLLVLGGWSIHALIYLVVVALLAVLSAAALDGLLRAAVQSISNSRQGLFESSNPWLVAALGIATVASLPTLLIGEYGPPLMLMVYPIFFAYFGGALVKEYVERHHMPR